MQGRAAQIVIARRQKVGNSPVLRQLVDKVNKAHVQLPRDAPVDYCVTRLQDETHRVRCRLLPFDPRR